MLSVLRFIQSLKRSPSQVLFNLRMYAEEVIKNFTIVVCEDMLLSHLEIFEVELRDVGVALGCGSLTRVISR